MTAPRRKCVDVCGAEPGEPCTDDHGQPLAEPHEGRFKRDPLHESERALKRERAAHDRTRAELAALRATLQALSLGPAMSPIRLALADVRVAQGLCPRCAKVPAEGNRLCGACIAVVRPRPRRR